MKTIQYNHDEAILAESAVASSQNVTYTLERSQQDEDIQEEIDEAAEVLKESMPDDIIRSIYEGATRGDSLPSDNVPILREMLMESRKKILADEQTPDDVAEQIIKFVNDSDNSQLFVYDKDHLSARSISQTRSSPGSTVPKRIFQDINTSGVISERLGHTASLAPLNQTVHNIAAIRHEMKNIDNSLDMILVHDEGLVRTQLFKPATVRILALIAFNGNNIELLALSTLVRAFSDLVECQIYLAILKKKQVNLKISYCFGFDPTEQATAELGRLLRREIIHDSYQEALDELFQLQMSDIVESFELDDVEKQLLFDLLRRFDECTKKISHSKTHHCNAYKAFKISDKNKDINSLGELTALTQCMSLQDDSGMSSVRDNKRANPPLGPLPKVIARNLIPKPKPKLPPWLHRKMTMVERCLHDEYQMRSICQVI